MESRFDLDTRVERRGPGRWSAQLDPGWWIVRGPNGGYLAAVLVNALRGEVADPARTLRSLTVHYLRPPAPGPAHIETRTERVGGSLTSVTARLLQGDQTQALATAAFSKPRRGSPLHHARMPEVDPPERATPPRRPGSPQIAIHQRYEQRFAVGAPPFSGERGSEALSGGWIRLAEAPRAPDPALLVAYADAWPPAVFSCSELQLPEGGVPTIDLTVHIRALPAPDLPPDDFVLVVFRTRVVHEGFLEEDGEIWSRDGRLLAQSRQLAILV